MSPIEAIVSWLEAQDLDLQIDVASFASFLIFEAGDVPSLSIPEQLEAVRQWLNEPELESHAAASRALTFRISMDYFVEGRTTGCGWKQTEAKLRKTLDDAKRVGKFPAARKAQRMLELLPTRQARWHEVARSWNELASTRLTLKALTDWSDKRPSLKTISSAANPPLVAIASRLRHAH
ncbi:hypothetical protein [Bradyrhizobium sp. CCGUVB23]|uniref:hypothetical protein n=1 Tax=Bradyrhizobium sp. CCGUVB23 TaxID=2949630 RepID=UPI0020B2AF32|nr:hypothetical protein [Bradyrhizobium sp. CCGUVB23]MCP3460578.1 hypothetical protein [Bradyrhizobium sp. CCGUVB23]